MGPPHNECSSKGVCDITRAIKSIGTEWSLIICYYLLEAPLGFNELLRTGKRDDLNSRTLSRTLKALVIEGIVRRTVISTQPFLVRYSLTEKGKTLEPILSAYRVWGMRWLAPETGPVPAQIMESRSPSMSNG